MTDLCSYGHPITPGDPRCGSCQFAGKGPAPCRAVRREEGTSAPGLSGAPPAAGDAPDGAEILENIRATIVKYMILPSAEAADAITLWIAATHAQPAWDCAPRLHIRSPMPQCGKSRLLDLIENLCNDPFLMVLASVATLYRSIRDAEPPTLLYDEIDAVFGGKDKTEATEAIRGVLNAGHQRGRKVPRCVPPDQHVEFFPTFAMAALAGIGKLPDTIEDRSVIIDLHRRAPGETVAKLRWKRVRPGLHELRGQLHAWARAHLAELRDADPELPVDDRPADTWEPLVSIADIAGGDWPERGRKACRVLCGAAAGSDIDTNIGIRLLSDLKDVFAKHTPADRAHTGSLLSELHKIEEAPWHEYFGKPLDARGLAKILGPFGVRSKDVWIDGVNLKGYRLEDLHGLFVKYLPTVEEDRPQSFQGTLDDVAESDDSGNDPGSVQGGARSARSARNGSDQRESPSAYFERPLGPLGEPVTPSGPSGHGEQGLGDTQATSGPSGPSGDLARDHTGNTDSNHPSWPDDPPPDGSDPLPDVTNITPPRCVTHACSEPARTGKWCCTYHAGNEKHYLKTRGQRKQ